MQSEKNPTLDAVVVVLADGGSRNFSRDAIRGMLSVLIESCKLSADNVAPIETDSLPMVNNIARPSSGVSVSPSLDGMSLKDKILYCLRRAGKPLATKDICNYVGIPVRQKGKRKYVYQVLKKMASVQSTWHEPVHMVRTPGTHPQFHL